MLTSSAVALVIMAGCSATPLPPDRRDGDVQEQRTQILFREVMEQLVNAVDSASPQETPFDANEPESRVYRAWYEAGFRLGVTGKASVKSGTAAEDAPRSQGWRAGQRAGLRVFFEVRQLLMRFEESQTTR